MAASTFPTHTWTNDTGTPANPNGDGTLLANAELQTFIGKINQMFGGGSPYNPLTFGGAIATEGFDANGIAASFVAGRTGGVISRTRNTTAGTANSAETRLGNDAADDVGRLIACASNFTTAGNVRADGLTVLATRAGGLVLAAAHASGAVRINTRVGFGVHRVSLGTNQTDYNLGGVDALVYIITPTVNNVQIDGLTGGFDGRAIVIINGHASNNLIIGHNTGSAGNGVLSAAGANLTMAGRSLMFGVYDGTLAAWIMGQKS